jgi:hypothetical protein
LHTIRLRGPWNCQPLVRFAPGQEGEVRPRTEDLPAGGVMAMPGDWGGVLGQDFFGVAKLTRRFQRPTGLTPTTRLWLTIDEAYFQAAVELNGTLLGDVVAGQAPARFNVTELLKARNILAVKLTSPDRAGQLGLVTLVIDEGAPEGP